jgi:hypothetical protein
MNPADPSSPASQEATRWQRLKDVVADALEQPPAEREAFLQENCEESLLAEARELVAAAADDDDAA